MNPLDKLVEKITSGRFLVTVMMSLTYCYLVSFIITKLSDKISGDFALGFVGGFSTSFMLIIQWYFQKESISEKTVKQNGGENGKEIIDIKPIVINDSGTGGTSSND